MVGSELRIQSRFLARAADGEFVRRSRETVS
jgi:hypothetical protein